MDMKAVIETTLSNLNSEAVFGDVFVIGDVHGYFDHLKALLDKIPQSASIYSVGDVIDRGPASVACLKLLCNEPRFRGMTMGNHELCFLQERLDGKECRSHARRRTHTEVNQLSPDAEKRVLQYMKNAKSFIRLVNPDTRHQCLITHGGIGVFDSLHDVSVHQTTGDRMNSVRNHKSPMLQVHGHMSWAYSGDMTGNVMNIDSGCYESGILSAINPFTKEVIDVRLSVE
jgi:hypothetical protein